MEGRKFADAIDKLMELALVKDSTLRGSGKGGTIEDTGELRDICRHMVASYELLLSDVTRLAYERDAEKDRHDKVMINRSAWENTAKAIELDREEMERQYCELHSFARDLLEFSCEHMDMVDDFFDEAYRLGLVLD